MKQLLTIAACIFFILNVKAQSVAINTDGSTAAASALLDIKSTGKGVLVPRMSKAQKNAIATPATGLLIFQDAPDSIGFYYYNGAAWLWLATANNVSGWATTGNAATDTAVNFIGTTDNMPLRFKQNNGWLGQLNKNTANYFIGSGAGQNNTSGTENTAIGDSALFSQSFSNGALPYSTFNTAIGSKALFFTQPSSAFDGFYNTAIGSNALYNNTSGSYNTAMGVSALFNTTTGFRNIAIGDATLYNLKTGGNNVAIGSGAGSSSSDSMRFSVLVGESAGGFNKRDRITAVGYGALTFNAFSTVNLNEGKENTAIGFASEQFNVQGSNNTSVGYYAMFGTNGSGSSGSRNVAVGDSALAVYSSGSNNIAIGASALSSLKTGTGNVAIGNASLRLITTGTNNTAAGDSSLSINMASDNAAFGSRSMLKNTFGFSNTAIGSGAMLNNSNGSNNTAVGSSSLAANLIATQNTALGYAALTNHKSGDQNVAVGSNALGSDTSSTGNVAVGSVAMFNNKNSLFNVAVGQGSLFDHKSGDYNVGLGVSALQSDTAGFQNVAVGAYTMILGKKSNNNTAVGYFSLSNTGRNSTNALEGNFNTAVGSNSGKELRRGYGNVAVGNDALLSDTSGVGNIAVGNGAALNHIGGQLNIAIGYFAMMNSKGKNKIAIGASALSQDTSANSNIAIGTEAMLFNRRGTGNVAVGTGALYTNSSGSHNIAVGDSSLPSNNFLVSSGNHFTNNTALGYKALFTTTSTSAVNGIDNTAIGASSGFANTSGTGNTFIGSASNASTGSLTNSTAIGYQSLTAQNNTMVLGSINGLNGATSSVNVGMGTNTPDARLHIVRNGASGGTYNVESGLILENSSIVAMQFSTPNGSPALLRSGNAATDQRSGITFEADSSINFNSGGSVNRMIIDNTGFVGVRNSSPASYLDVSGSMGNAISTSTASTTLDQFGHTHIILPTASAVLITLPAASTCNRREYTIVNQDNSVQVISSYIDFTGAASITLLANTSITIQSNGISWYRIR